MKNENMTPEQFVYWLQGTMELADPKTLDARQVQIIKDHLALVLKKVTPERKMLLEDKPSAESPEESNAGEVETSRGIRFTPPPSLVKLCTGADTYC